MTAQRAVTIGRDARGNIIVPGNHNRLFVVLKEPSAALLAQLESGALQPEAVAEAVPLPTLVLGITSTPDDPHQWTLQADYPGVGAAAWTRPAPGQATPGFAAVLEAFRALSRRRLETQQDQQRLQAQALTLGEALGTILDEAARDTLTVQGRQPGAPPLLIIETAEAPILALPWELLRLEGGYAVHEGRLDIARCVPNEGAPGINAVDLSAAQHFRSALLPLTDRTP